MPCSGFFQPVTTIGGRNLVLFSDSKGFTLIEVLVALAILSIALLVGLQAAGALTRDVQRQTDALLSQVCAENALVQVRLMQQMPDLGSRSEVCEVGGRVLDVTLTVAQTPNPNFRYVKAQARLDTVPLRELATVVGRF